MTKNILSIVLLTALIATQGMAQNADPDKSALLQDRRLQLGLQLGGIMGDNEQPSELKDLKYWGLSPRLFLDYGLTNYLRGQISAGFGMLRGQFYKADIIPIDYRFMVIPTYSKTLSPYFYLGLGGLHYDVTAPAYRMSPGMETNAWVAYVPVGLGLVHEFSDRVALDVNVGYNFIFSDNVNGHLGGPHDSYLSVMLGVRVPLAAQTYAEREREELQRQIAEQERLKKEAELQAADEQKRKAAEAQKALEDQKRKAEEAQKALEAQKAEEARKALEAQKAQEAQKPVEPAAPKAEQPKPMKPEVKFEPVYFPTGGAILTAAERAKLDAAAKTLKENPDIDLEVSGHTDNVGSRAVNDRIALMRAKAVKKYLVGKGIGAKRLTTQAFAFDRPIADNATEEGRRENRRTELEIKK